jgi:hypothetical protein
VTEPIRHTKQGKSPAAGEEQRGRLKQTTLSSIVTLLLTAVIIAGGFMLPTLFSPLLDSYRNNLIQLSGPTDDMVSGHVFEEPVTLYPWNIYDESQVRGLTNYEMITLEQSGVADLLVSNMQLRGLELVYDYGAYVERILSSFGCLEPLNSSEPGCFVLVDADIDFDDSPDLRCAVDFSGNLISLLLVSEKLNPLKLTAPLMASTEQAAEGEATAADNGSPGETGSANGSGGTDTEGSTPGSSVPSASTTAADDTQVDYRPLPEEENIWLFSYVLSREALTVGQYAVYSAFRQLDLGYEARFEYPYISLTGTPPQYVEALPEIEPVATTNRQLTTGKYLLRIYDFSSGERLILYINSDTQHCDGFNLSTMPM